MDWKAKQMAKASAAAAIQAANPGLIPVSACKGGALIAASKNIKIELGRAFPGIKFSIKTSRYSGGDSISVRWTDGPTSDQVDDIVKRYQGGYFDGMVDCYEYVHDAWRDAFGDAKFVFATREMSDAAIEKAIRLVRSKYEGNLARLGLPNISLEGYKRGDYRNVQLIEAAWAPGQDLLSDVIRQLAYRQCYALTKAYGESKQLEEV